jgi:alkylation response protein AidB-like acyl-CoA dehydrogenase
MRFLGHDSTELRSMLRSYSQEKIQPHVAAWDAQEALPQEFIADLGAMGFLGVTLPEAAGGAGLNSMDYAVIVEELSRVDPSVGLTVAAHNSLGLEHLYRYASPELQEEMVKPLARGEALAAWALTEPGSGSDASGLRSRAKRVGDQYLLNGSKTFITNPTIGRVTVVIAREEDGISAFAIPHETPGFSIGRKLLKLGMRASDTAEVILSDCRLPQRFRLGESGEGFRQAKSILAGGRISIAALAVGVAQGAFEVAHKYAAERETFGKSINRHQSVANMLADMATEIAAARLLTMQAAWQRDQDVPYLLAASQAKLFASELAVRVANNAVQILGGYGYMREYPAEKYYRDAKLATIGEGTSEVQRLVIAKILRGD